MLSDDDKRRIEAEEAYRAQVRGKQNPVRVETSADRWNRGVVRFVLISLTLISLFILGSCLLR